MQTAGSTDSRIESGIHPFRIAIIGAGIAGLAAAIGLRGPNRHITIFEASALKAEAGAAICCPPNALKILRRWGLDPDTDGAPTQGKILREINLEDQLVMSVPTAKRGNGNLGVWYFYHRQDFHSMLRAFAEREDLPGSPTTIRCGARVLSVDCQAGIVSLDSGDTFTADLIVGADGIHSKVRESILHVKTLPQPSGHSAYRCLIPKHKLSNSRIAEVLNPDEPGMTIVTGVDRRVIFYPCRKASVLNVVAILPDKLLNETSTENWTAEGNLGDLLIAYKDFPTWVLETFSKADKLALYQLRAQPPLETWHTGRAVVIGDAAHAMLPHQAQGAAQAIEDAEALQAVFEQESGRPQLSDIACALETVMKARYERASLIQEYSRQKAMPASNASGAMRLNSTEFTDYNWNYDGARDWMKRQSVPA